ncbi:MAG: HNH endonuclease [candidate division Zixibacteria bacterium]|nr:HNH endonuclease [candidate division Zixibacteria bacterium]MBU1471147.1 HNH endonuclease [candidate division Zixibacteria bacterium]MBU2626663.1 HNH endonuclease [candidate division Zixibacteria bacterium]
MHEKYPNQSIFERDKFKCQYCDLDASKDFKMWWTANLSIDHVVPKSKGGTDDPSNLVVACHSCNLFKGSASCSNIEEARDVVAERKEQARMWFRKHVTKEEA